MDNPASSVSWQTGRVLSWRIVNGKSAEGEVMAKRICTKAEASDLLSTLKESYQAAKLSSFEAFAERISPRNLGYSPRMAAIVGAIIGHDYGVRDNKGGRLTGLSITSDGFVTAQSTASDGGGAFIGSAYDLDRNLADYRFTLAGVDDEDAEEFDKLYNQNVRNWRKL